MPLTPQEKVKIRHHAGYLNAAEQMAFVLGAPAGVETQFLIEGAMNRILEDALPELRRHLGILDKIEESIIENLDFLVAEKLGDITIDANVMEKLTKQYDYWVASMCALMGVNRNPFDQRLKMRGINVGVRG